MKRVNVILAGGASRRFGEPKAFAKWKGGMFYEQAKKSLRRRRNGNYQPP